MSTSVSRVSMLGLAYRLLALVCWAYLAAVLGAWLLLQWADQWWPATVLMFAPRWALALPLVILLPLAGCMRSWAAVVVLMATGLVVGWPVMGFSVPWSRLTAREPTGTPLRVMTLNMHYSDADPKPLEDLIAAAAPDIIAIQEWRGYERAALRTDPGWHVHATPRLFLASRHPIKKAVELGGNSMGEHASATHYELDMPAGTAHVFNLHAATNRYGLADTLHEDRKGPAEVSANSNRRREQFAFVAGKAAECKGPVLIVGDFNTPSESSLFPAVWRGYTDAFSAAGWGWGYTFYGTHTSVRIDHVLFGGGWACTDCRVGPFIGSPHRPVIAELVWIGDKLTDAP
jgi:endonuclease/exonuclease/phosphatase (EEP) superfamily protein YafD